LDVLTRFSGARMRARRLELGLTLVELAGLTGWPWDTLRNYERGETSPSADRLLTLAATLRCPADDLGEPCDPRQ
jgi:transcriptional regulator with XRE-family HTH domain